MNMSIIIHKRTLKIVSIVYVHSIFIYHTKVNRQNPNFDHTIDILDYIEWIILPQKNILQSWSEIIHHKHLHEADLTLY